MSESGYRDRLREAILAIAHRIVEAEGLGALQARRIARDAECSVGSIYNVFGDIDGLVIALNGQTLARLGIDLGKAQQTAAGGSLEDRLLALALAYARFAMENRELWRAVFAHQRPAGMPVPDAYLADQARLLALLEALLQAVIGDGARRAQAARALFGSVHGIVALAVDDRLGGTVALELDEEIRILVGLIARGLAGA